MRPRGQAAFGTKVEIKNMNSFSAMQRAIEFEIARQVELLEGGRGSDIVQETRLWDEGRQCTYSMRRKEVGGSRGGGAGGEAVSGRLIKTCSHPRLQNGPGQFLPHRSYQAPQHAPCACLHPPPRRAWPTTATSRSPTCRPCCSARSRWTSCRWADGQVAATCGRAGDGVRFELPDGRGRVVC